jgi:alkaline phosphatase D
MNRREIMGAGIAAVGTIAASNSRAQINSNNAITKIAWGSCANQDKRQPIWGAIAQTNPDLFLFIGDNIYADTNDPEVMRRKYEIMRQKPEFARFREAVPIMAMWDDHDYGINDGGAEYEMKVESRKQFCDFWNVAQDSPRRTRPDGIYTSEIIGPDGRKVQIILPDLRWNRTPIQSTFSGRESYERWARAQFLARKPIPGPYIRNPDDAATMLGASQWQWLEGELEKPADLRIFASSLQVVADFPGWEAWINYHHDHQKLIEAIRRHRSNALICLSGDTHYGEISRLDVNVPYPLWDFTSSGITEVWPVIPPNSRRIGEAYRDRNFGLIQIDWDSNSVKVSIHGENGAVKLEQSINLASLRVPRF